MILEISTSTAVLTSTALIIAHLRHRRFQKQSESEIHALELRLKQELQKAYDERNRLLDALGDAFLLVDSTGSIRFANEAARTLFGARELLNRPVGEAFLDPRLVDALLRCMATGEPVQSRVVLPQQTSPRGDLENRGFNAWVIDAAQLPTPVGGSITTRVIIRDVTTEHQLEQVRKDFVANASHELRTPLAIINGYLENLLNDDMIEEPEMARRFLTIMKKHADRISRIVEDMLVISRLESGEVNTLKVEPFRFASCVKDILERLESVIRNQQAEIVVKIANPEAVMQGDRFYWTQVLFNLVENALKQNPYNGLRVEIGGEEVGSNFHAWVTDNGVGIPSADLPHIFRRFFRVEKHHSQQEIKGTGLGLSIVKRAIEAHGGRISVTSVPGSETKFLIVVPREIG
ncbi:MAG: PAS domain-containing protein [Akkermansiaceae bacterium]|nr:PAS domain-containing protein [Akkermansiaceae bacterium]NJR43538.1 PAS domain-containing protein [Akkermansiaceae bacterium]